MRGVNLLEGQVLKIDTRTVITLSGVFWSGYMVNEITAWIKNHDPAGPHKNLSLGLALAFNKWWDREDLNPDILRHAEMRIQTGNRTRMLFLQPFCHWWDVRSLGDLARHFALVFPNVRFEIQEKNP